MATTKKQVTHEQEQELVTEDMSFMEGMEGMGLEGIKENQAVSYLSLVQPDSAVESEENPAGTWRNSASNKNYGNMIRVIPLDFRTIWNEREADPPFRSVGRYDPHSIPVETRMPPKGKRGFPKMVNPETGNEIQELFIYAVILPDFPEDGVLYFNPTVGSMRTCKAWNTQIASQIIAGKQAPIFGYSWNLIAELAPNPQQPSKQITRFTKVIRDTICSKDIFVDHIKPQLDTVKRNTLQITASSESEE